MEWKIGHEGTQSELKEQPTKSLYKKSRQWSYKFS